MAFVNKRGSAWYLGWLDENGMQQRRASKARGRMEAQRMADELEREAEAVRLGLKRATKPDITFRVAGALYLASLPADYGSKTHLESRLRLRVYPHIGDMWCRRIVPGDIGRTLNAATLGDLSPEDNKARGEHLVPNAKLEPQGREHLRIAIQGVYTFLIEQEKRVEGENPAAVHGPVDVPKRKKKHLPWRLVPQLLAAVPEELRLLFTFCVATGVRKGEAFALTWADVLIDGEALPDEWVEKLVEDELEGAELLEGMDGGFARISKSHGRDKTKAGKDRVVPIAGWLAAELREARKRSTSSVVFPGEDGKRMPEGKALHKVMRAALLRAGLVSGYALRCVNRGKALKSCGYAHASPKQVADLRCPNCGKFSLDVQPVPLPLTFRHLRSTFAVAQLRAGGSIKGVADMLGNTESVAAGHYAGLLPQDLLRQANRLQLLGSQLGVGSGKQVPQGALLGHAETGES